MAVQPKYHYDRGFHPTATCGVFGAAITAAKLMDLTEEQTLSAVGIAGSMAAGSLEFLAEGAWTKRLHAGLAAQNGIQAAELARAGFKGPATIIEGRYGFLRGYTDAPRPDVLTAVLGQNWAILETSIKPHACCRYKQGPIDALLEIRARHAIDWSKITRVEVAILEAGAGLIAEPPERKYAPQSIVDAQFSMPFGAAVALIHGRAGLAEYCEANLHSTDVRGLMQKVVMVRDPALEKNFPREWPARVAVEMQSGDRYETSVRQPKGDPANPLTWAELSAKFISLGGTPELEARVSSWKTGPPPSLVREIICRA
jgi:2-methylcitrate dehydratase PrpD